VPQFIVETSFFENSTSQTGTEGTGNMSCLSEDYLFTSCQITTSTANNGVGGLAIHSPAMPNEKRGRRTTDEKSYFVSVDFVHCTANNGGAGGLFWYTSYSCQSGIVNCSFSQCNANSTATGDGGGVYFYPFEDDLSHTSFVFSFCFFQDNSAVHGNDVYLMDTFFNKTPFSNSSSTTAGGRVEQYNSSASFTSDWLLR
jgi:hypothetical protein